MHIPGTFHARQHYVDGRLLASGLQLGAVEVFGNHSVTFRQSEFSLVDNNLLASVWTNSIKVARVTPATSLAF